MVIVIGANDIVKQDPGEFRRSQVWLGDTQPGNAAFVPPPAGQLADCRKAFEHFLHDEPEPTSPLLRVALAQVQFETIHPFLDGNGCRAGRRHKADASHCEKILVHLLRLGVVGELTARQRGRVFARLDYLALLNAELAGARPTLTRPLKKTR